jgi:tRNA(Arg) A34 adenosine deaminase TadA
MINPVEMALLQQAVVIAKRARQNGNHPFGALLAEQDGIVLLEVENNVVTSNDPTGHAETNLVRLASQKYDQEFLAGCSLYTSTEPCVMCSGAIYWSGIGRVVYALSEVDLLHMTASDQRNLTMSLPCREVFAHGQRVVQVVGPVEIPEAIAVHQGFWNDD